MVREAEKEHRAAERRMEERRKADDPGYAGLERRVADRRHGPRRAGD